METDIIVESQKHERVYILLNLKFVNFEEKSNYSAVYF